MRRPGAASVHRASLPLRKGPDVGIDIGFGTAVPENRDGRSQLFYRRHVLEIAVVKAHQVLRAHFLNQGNSLRYTISFWLNGQAGMLLAEHQR